MFSVSAAEVSVELEIMTETLFLSSCCFVVCIYVYTTNIRAATEESSINVFNMFRLDFFNFSLVSVSAWQNCNIYFHYIQNND